MSTVTMTASITKPTESSLPLKSTASQHRVSLERLYKIAEAATALGGVVALHCDPALALRGAFGGAAFRLFVGDGSKKVRDEEPERAHTIARLCFLASGAAYMACAPAPHFWAPIVLGFLATSDAVYPFLRRTL